VRALPRVGDEATAAAWVEAAVDGSVRVTVPDLIYGEVANALLRYVRTGGLTPADADEAMRLILEVPLRVVSLRSLAVDALRLARELGMSAYDATYVLLAEATGATLVTADRRLAAAGGRAALIPGEGPPADERSTALLKDT
jgi:predicted nucleic acid-binding protein